MRAFSDVVMPAFAMLIVCCSITCHILRKNRCLFLSERERERELSSDLVDGGAVGFVHLVELVDAADAHVCQHQ